MHIVFLFTIGEFNLGRFELTLWALRNLLLTERDASLLADLLVELYHVSLGVVSIALTITVLVYEDLSPQWVLTHIDPLLWLKQGLAGELLLASLLSSLHNPGSLFLDTSDQTF